MTSEERFDQALEDIEHELDTRIDWFESNDGGLEAHRLDQRTRFDLEMLNEAGSCLPIRMSRLSVFFLLKELP